MATLVPTARFFFDECKGDDPRKQRPAAWAKPALPYPCLLINLSLVTCPSTMPLLIHQVRPALANGKRDPPHRRNIPSELPRRNISSECCSFNMSSAIIPSLLPHFIPHSPIPSD